MNEIWLRFQGIIGSSKRVAIFLFAAVLVISVGTFVNLLTALSNPTQPKTVSISQLVENDSPADRYVQVRGVAVYQVNYEEKTTDDITMAIYYPLIEVGTGNIVFVRTNDVDKAAAPDKQVTVSGMIHTAPGDLSSRITEDLAMVTKKGIKVSNALYIQEGETPGSIPGLLIQAAIFGFIMLVCAATLFFPGTVFAPRPLQSSLEKSSGLNTTKATGTFQRVMKVSPAIEFGSGLRAFHNSAANIFVTENEEKRIAIFIRYIQKTSVNLIPIFTSTTDWIVVLRPERITAIEPGKIYGWSERWAVSIRYTDTWNRAQRLILSFGNNAGQIQFMNLLKEHGYPVGILQYAPAAMLA